MIHTLRKLFPFLEENQHYNKQVRKLEYDKAMLGCTSSADKLKSLVVFVFSTQAFPKLDKLYTFVSSTKNAPTMEAFIQQLIENKSFLKRTDVCNAEAKPCRVDYNVMFKALISQDGWGEKTAALFCKIVYDIHKNYPEHRFWADAPRTLTRFDELYLPVDEVIKHIFNDIDPYTWDFGGINREIKTAWEGDDILLWDDLWFWGFITQRGSNQKRKTELNAAKLITLQGINMDQYEEILERANEFIALIKED